jgi:hypothetical protein
LVQHDPASSSPDDPRAVGAAWTDGLIADAAGLGRHLHDLAVSDRGMPRQFARRRAASISLFVADHDADFARAGLTADRRASLQVRAVRLEDVVAWEDWDEVRAVVAAMTFDLAPYLFPAPAPPEPPPTEMPSSRTVRVIWRRGRHRTADERGRRSAEGSGTRIEHDGRH